MSQALIRCQRNRWWYGEEGTHHDHLQWCINWNKNCVRIQIPLPRASLHPCFHPEICQERIKIALNCALQKHHQPGIVNWILTPQCESTGPGHHLQKMNWRSSEKQVLQFLLLWSYSLAGELYHDTLFWHKPSQAEEGPPWVPHFSFKWESPFWKWRLIVILIWNNAFSFNFPSPEFASPLYGSSSLISNKNLL